MTYRTYRSSIHPIKTYKPAALLTNRSGPSTLFHPSGIDTQLDYRLYTTTCIPMIFQDFCRSFTMKVSTTEKEAYKVGDI
jgi:hypothetical protein